MNKYINTDELNKAVEKCQDEPFTKDTVYAITELLPSADVRENTHGEWEYISFTGLFKCSHCGEDMVRNVYPYCPWCGADMRGDNK